MYGFGFMNKLTQGLGLVYLLTCVFLVVGSPEIWVWFGESAD